MDTLIISLPRTGECRDFTYDASDQFELNTDVVTTLFMQAVDQIVLIVNHRSSDCVL